MPRHFVRTAAFTALASCAALGIASDRHALEDPIPPGARGAVLEFSGKVSAITGLASGVAGRVDPVGAALKELGARVTEQEIRIEMSADVLFDFDRAELKPEAEGSLQKVATVLGAYARAQVTVEGHTDAKGSEAYNQRLSDRRAAAVVGWLHTRAGLGGERLTARGLGAQRPVAPNTRADGSDDPEGRRRNRRVEIVVQTAG
jgi:outer membrane protein OmpA-like peptidoglycan-associated protein